MAAPALVAVAQERDPSIVGPHAGGAQLVAPALPRARKRLQTSTNGEILVSYRLVKLVSFNGGLER